MLISKVENLKTCEAREVAALKYKLGPIPFENIYDLAHNSEKVHMSDIYCSY